MRHPVRLTDRPGLRAAMSGFASASRNAASPTSSATADGRAPRMRRPIQGPAARIARLSSIFVAMLLLAACASTPPMPPPRTPRATTYIVGSPDTLFVTILPDPTVERTVVVRPDGMISIDLIGDVMAAGRTTEQIGAEIQERLQRFKRDARATVSVETSSSLAITVFGEVQSPGTFPLRSDTRISEAIGLRGGTNIFASKKNVRLVRTNGEITRVFKIDLARIEQGDLSENIMVRGGDMVIVPPNSLAKIGYGLQVMLFPFQQLLTAGTGAAAAAALF